MRDKHKWEESAALWKFDAFEPDNAQEHDGGKVSPNRFVDIAGKSRCAAKEFLNLDYRCILRPHDEDGHEQSDRCGYCATETCTNDVRRVALDGCDVALSLSSTSVTDNHLRVRGKAIVETCTRLSRTWVENRETPLSCPCCSPSTASSLRAVQSKLLPSEHLLVILHDTHVTGLTCVAIWDRAQIQVKRENPGEEQELVGTSRLCSTESHCPVEAKRQKESEVQGGKKWEEGSVPRKQTTRVRNLGGAMCTVDSKEFERRSVDHHQGPSRKNMSQTSRWVT